MNYIYGALLLHKEGKEINSANLKKVVEATGIEADEAKIKVLVASLKGVDIDKELESAAIVSSAPATHKEEAKAEEKKEEKHEEAAEGLSALFG